MRSWHRCTAWQLLAINTAEGVRFGVWGMLPAVLVAALNFVTQTTHTVAPQPWPRVLCWYSALADPAFACGCVGVDDKLH
jgi:hypothetical protein